MAMIAASSSSSCRRSATVCKKIAALLNRISMERKRTRGNGAGAAVLCVTRHATPAQETPVPEQVPRATPGSTLRSLPGEPSPAETSDGKVSTRPHAPSPRPPPHLPRRRQREQSRQVKSVRPSLLSLEKEYVATNPTDFMF
jgi:hypothetical protein